MPMPLDAIIVISFIIGVAAILSTLVAIAVFKPFRKKLWSTTVAAVDKLWLLLAVIFICLIVYKSMFFVPQTRTMIDEVYCESDADCYMYTHEGSPDSATCNCNCYPSCSNRKLQVDCKKECNTVCFWFDAQDDPIRFRSPYECMCIDNRCEPAKNVTKPCEFVCNDVIDRWGCDPVRLKNYEADYTRFGMTPPFSRSYNMTWTENDCFNLYNCSCPMLGPEGVIY